MSAPRRVPLVVLELGRALESSLSAFAQDQGVAEETVVLAAWLSFLARSDGNAPRMTIETRHGPFSLAELNLGRHKPFVDQVVAVHNALRRRTIFAGENPASFVVSDAVSDATRGGADDVGYRMEYLGEPGEKTLRGVYAAQVHVALKSVLGRDGSAHAPADFGPPARSVGAACEAVHDGGLVLACLDMARRQPDAPAIVTPLHTWIYAECAQAVRSWSARIAAGTTVAIRSDDPFFIVCAPLAVLAAGACFVMLDPSIGASRTARMLEIAEVDAIVGNHAAGVPGDVPFIDLGMPGDDACIDAQPTAQDDRLPGCITFTSGSTGFPRACMLSRQALRELGSMLQRMFGGQRVLHLGSVSFDIFLHNLSLAIGGGGTLFMAGPLHPERVVAYAEIWQIDHFCGVPSVLRMLDQARLCGDRQPTIVSVGEACTEELAARFRYRARFFDAYGCTEANVANLFAAYAQDNAPGPAGLEPLPGFTAAVLDDSSRPVSFGVVGELAMAGSNLGLAYVGSARETASRFIPDAHGMPGSRMFRTGDRGRMSPDGRVSLHGRIDRRVKLLGAQIDLAEIEKVGKGVEGVLDAAAFVTAEPSTVKLAFVADPLARLPHLERQWVDQWVHAFDHGLDVDGGDFAGWTSAITGLPIHEAEMREWLEASCARIRSHAPASVLEVGCGTGAVMRELVAHCRDVWGTDISEKALDIAAARLAGERGGARVRLLHQAANERVARSGRFDAAVMNSVVQYMPGSVYLADVLSLMVDSVRPGGHVYVLDVRDLRLRALYDACIRKAGGVPGAQEHELLVDPRFFLAWAEETQSVGGVELLLREGRTGNELNSFRYDVVIHVGARGDLEPMHRVPWSGTPDFGGLAAPVQITGIPNGRLVAAGEDPMRLCDLASAHGLEATAALNLDDADAFDLIIGGTWLHRPGGYAGDGHVLASDPLVDDRQVEVATALNVAFTTELAPWMRPTDIVARSALPRMLSGKVDHAALAASDAEFAPVVGSTVTAQMLGALWEDILGSPPASAQDHFFQRGGHSLQAVRLTARVASSLGIGLALSTLFNEPTFGGFLARVEAARLSSQAREGFALQRAPVLPHYPMTTAQARVWFLEQLTPGTATYHLPVALDLTGPLDVVALKAAFRAVVDRHEPLRARFGLVDGEPVQWFDPAGEIDMPVMKDMRLSNEETARWIRDFGRKPFALGLGRCYRVALLERGPQSHVFVMVLHHLVADGWSMRILADDLCRAYLAGTDGMDAVGALAKLPFSFRDYAYSRNALSLSSDDDLRWWIHRLQNQPDSAGIADRRRRAARDGRGSLIYRQMPLSRVDDLRMLARGADATLYMVLLTAFVLLVGRHGTDRDLTIGTPVANRPHADLTNLVGFFANTVALRFHLSPNESFRRFLGKVREVVVASFDHQDCAFERVVEALRPARDLSSTPIFQHWFAFLDMQLIDRGLGELRIDPMQVGDVEAAFDLSLSIALTEQGLALSLSYDSALFSASYAEQLADRYVRLIDGLPASFDRAAGDIDILSVNESSAIRLAATGDPPIPFPGPHLALATNRSRRPADIAVSDAQGNWTYEEFDRQVDRLATAVRRRVVPGEVLGIRMRRSARSLAMVLGAYRAGVPFVLIEPDHPPERQASMIADAHVVTCVGDADWDDFAAACPGPSSWSEPPPSSPAYICFTSGSTGKPKGVVVPRSALHFLLGAMSARLGASPTTVMLGVTAPSFDIAMLEWFLPICAGGRLVLGDEGPFDAAAIVARAVREGVNVVQATPSTWRLLEGAGFSAHTNSGMTLLSGGEVLPGDLARALTLGGATLFNCYGPTETTIWSTLHAVSALGEAPADVSIGRPIAGTRCLVLDERLRPVPDHVVGELFIGGHGVALGYAGRPAETAARFLPDSNGPLGARMYATGDLVRRSTDGLLHYVGRRDQQVKLRGVRIDLAAIEHVALDGPEARDACAFVVGADATARIVVACVADATDLDAIRHRAEKHLPTSMLPERWIALPVLPRRPNGKRDVRALASLADEPLPTVSTAWNDDVVFAAVASICAAVVGRSSVDATEHFFADLGGHSLMALRLVERIETRFGIQLPLRSLFETPRVGDIASRVVEAIASAKA